jgi:site-specific recombinase XerD
LESDLVIEAAKFYVKRHKTNIVPKSVTEVYEELVEDAKARNLSSRYVANLRYRCGSFSESFEMPIASVRAEDIRGYLGGLKLSARSQKNFVRAINRLFQFAQERNYLPADCQWFGPLSQFLSPCVGIRRSLP